MFNNWHGASRAFSLISLARQQGGGDEWVMRVEDMRENLEAAAEITVINMTTAVTFPE